MKVNNIKAIMMIHTHTYESPKYSYNKQTRYNVHQHTLMEPQPFTYTSELSCKRNELNTFPNNCGLGKRTGST